MYYKQVVSELCAECQVFDSWFVHLQDQMTKNGENVYVCVRCVVKNVLEIDRRNYYNADLALRVVFVGFFLVVVARGPSAEAFFPLPTHSCESYP